MDSTEALSLIRKGKWSTAREKLEAVLAKEPEYPDAEQRLATVKTQEQLAEWYGKAQEHLMRANWQEAITCLEEVVKLDSAYENAKASLDKARREYQLEALYREGIQYFVGRAWQNARKSFDEILDMQPDGYRDVREKLDEVNKQLRFASQYEQALGCESAEQWSEAIRIYVSILTEDPVYPEVAEKLVRAREENELLVRYMQAKSDLHNRKLVAAIELLSGIVERRRDYKEAAQMLQEARDLQEAEISYREGLKHFNGEEWGQAVEKLGRTVQLDPNNKDAFEKLEAARKNQSVKELRDRAIQALVTGESVEAIRELECVLGVAPDDQNVRDLLEAARRHQEEKARHRAVASDQDGETLPGEIGERQRGKRRLAESTVTVTKNPLRKLPVDGEKGCKWWLRHVIVPVVVVLFASGGIATILLKHFLSPRELAQPSAPVISPSSPSTAIYEEIESPSPLLTGKLCNGDFESGFDCWQQGGEMDQNVECDGNQCYAVLGNRDYGCESVPVGEAWIKQSFQVSGTVSSTLSLSYRVFSYDLDDHDFFQVSVNGQQIGLFGNTEWNESSCDREVWDSGWRSIDFDLGPYRGENVELSLRNANGTDKGWNTWTYVDNVEVH